MLEIIRKGFLPKTECHYATGFIFKSKRWNTNTRNCSTTKLFDHTDFKFSQYIAMKEKQTDIVL